jgi:transposase
MEEGVTKKANAPKKVFRMRKVKLNPTKEQKALLRKFEGAARYTYNATVAAVNNKQHALNKMSLRNAFVTAKDNQWVRDRPWLTETPKAIRQQAVFEAVKNFKSAFTNQKNGNIGKFKMQFKKKRHGSQRPWTIGLEKAVKAKDSELYVLPESIGKMRYYGKLPFENKPISECSLHRDACGHLYLQVPIQVEVKPTRQTNREVALDPGVRKFLTGYSPTEECGFFVGQETSKRILGILRSIDQVCSDLDRADITCVQRRRLRKKKAKLYRDYKNLRDDFHYKVISFLTDHFDTVYLPHLETKKLSQTLKAKAAREMMAQSHGLFLQRLKDVCDLRGVTLFIPDEAYTSKTCGSCGLLENVGSSETFRCSSCGYVADRDFNAARNIYIKAKYDLLLFR